MAALSTNQLLLGIGLVLVYLLLVINFQSWIDPLIVLFAVPFALAGVTWMLFVVQTLGEVPDSFAVTSEHTDRLSAQASRLNQAEILRAIDLLAAAIAAVKDGSEPRIQLEMALLKASQPSSDLSLQALMFRIEQLERRIQGGAAPAAAPPEAAPERVEVS